MAIRSQKEWKNNQTNEKWILIAMLNENWLLLVKKNEKWLSDKEWKWFLIIQKRKYGYSQPTEWKMVAGGQTRTNNWKIVISSQKE